MTDNVNIPSSGDVPVASKEIGGVQYPKVIVYDSSGVEVQFFLAPADEGSVAAVSVTSVATLLMAANTQRRSVTIVNNGDQTVYVGYDATVTTDDGLPLAPGATMVEADSSKAMYGIVSAGTCDARVAEV